jgi:hypothetical protein
MMCASPIQRRGDLGDKVGQFAAGVLAVVTQRDTVSDGIRLPADRRFELPLHAGDFERHIAMPKDAVIPF